MSSFFSSDGPFSLQFAIIFAIIFLMLAAGVLLMRRFTGQGASLASKAGTRGRQPRLGIVDIYELDRQRQLILLRRDNVEHLLLVGGPNDVVVERNITRGINARLATEETAYDEPSEPVPEHPAAMPHRAPPAMSLPSELPPQAPPAMPYREPSFEMPVVVPAPAPGSAVPPIARPLDPPPRPEPAETFRPTPPAAAPQRREFPFARVIRRAPPSLVNLVPAALAERVRSPGGQPEPEPGPVRPPLAETPPPLVAPPAARAIDAAILSDMARQLEEALRRPSAAVRPAAPAQAEPIQAPVAAQEPAPDGEPEPIPALAPAVDEPERPAPPPEPVMEIGFPSQAEAHPIDPIAAAMAATAEPVAPPESEHREPEIDHSLFREEPETPEAVAPEPDRTEPTFVEPPALEPVAVVPAPAEPVHHEEPVIHGAIADAPRIEEPAPVEPAPPPVAPATPESAPASKPSSSPNPFSVEEIEAEFARLLGRPLDRKL